jgi:hypothetical protein
MEILSFAATHISHITSHKISLRKIERKKVYEVLSSPSKGNLMKHFIVALDHVSRGVKKRL